MRRDLKVPMLPELTITIGGPFETVGTTEENQRAAVLVGDFGTVSKSISADLGPYGGTYGSNIACI